MLEEMIKSVVKKTIDTEYQHLLMPNILTAIIASASHDGEIYTYDLKILDKNGVSDDTYPIIPGVKSKLIFTTNSTVAIGLLYGQLNPYILGEVI